MKKILLPVIGLSLILLMVGCGKKEESKEANTETKKMAQVDEPVIYYTCPMESHKDVHSKEAGKCTKCNMDLVPGVITSEEKMEYYGCPMLIHSHVRSDKPGTCDDCGMKLKPMRLVKG